MEVFRFYESSDICPKTVPMQPIHKEVDLVLSSSMSNYTRAKDDKKDESSGTLSAAALQCILEYTTRPGDIVLTLNAQFGAIYDVAENCGRLVFGTESHPHFQNKAFARLNELRRPSTTTIDGETKGATERAWKVPVNKAGRKVYLNDDEDDDDDQVDPPGE